MYLYMDLVKRRVNDSGLIVYFLTKLCLFFPVVSTKKKSPGCSINSLHEMCIIKKH